MQENTLFPELEKTYRKTRTVEPKIDTDDFVRKGKDTLRRYQLLVNRMNKLYAKNMIRYDLCVKTVAYEFGYSIFQAEKIYLKCPVGGYCKLPPHPLKGLKNFKT